MKRVLAVANIIEKEGKILLVQESKEKVKGKYAFPSGKVEFNEDILDGAKREAKEETGLDVQLDGIVTIVHRPKKEKDVVIFIFKSSVIGGEITPSPEHPEVKYFSYDKINALHAEGKLRAGYILPALEDYKKGTIYDLSLIKKIISKP